MPRRVDDRRTTDQHIRARGADRDRPPVDPIARAVRGPASSLLIFPHGDIVGRPAPKPGRHYETGWEHAEIALGDDLEKVADFLRTGDHGLAVDWRAWKKEVNRDVSISCPRDFSIKLHAAPLDEVVAMEKAEGLVVPVPPDYWEDRARK